MGFHYITSFDVSSLMSSLPLSSHPFLFLRIPSSEPVHVLLPPDASLATLSPFPKGFLAHITHKAPLSAWIFYANLLILYLDL